MPETKIHVEVDGQIDTLERYVLVYPNGIDTTFMAEADIYSLGKAMMLTYDAFLKECAKVSDQDLYEVCNALDLNYDLTRRTVAEWRNNG